MSETITLYRDDVHRNLLLPVMDAGEGVPTNQHLIIADGEAMLLDPGGTKLYPRVFGAVAKELKGAKLKNIFCSHQDPDVVASLNGWLMTTDAQALASELWRRFIPHFGSDKLVYGRVSGIPDGGMRHMLGKTELILLPAHFLHSVGNFQVYDPTSRILYSGDLGVSLGEQERIVTDFDAHVPLMAGFHRRYMVANKALRAWARMVRTLDIEIIAPQHGAMFVGKPMVKRFIDWAETVECGLDVMEDVFKVPV